MLWAKPLVSALGRPRGWVSNPSLSRPPQSASWSYRPPRPDTLVSGGATPSNERPQQGFLTMIAPLRQFLINTAILIVGMLALVCWMERQA